MAIKDAIKLIKIACTKWSLGYDQNNRLDFRDGGETDCSALVIIVCEKSGLLPGNDIRKKKGALYTGNMLRAFKDRGWLAYRNLPEKKLQPGDVLLVPQHHTAMYVGNGQLAMARIDEHGNTTGGASGRTGGRETVVRPYYNYPWTYVLRFHGAVQPPTPKPPAAAKPGALVVDGEIGKDSAKKLQAILGLRQTGKIDKRTFAAVQTHIGAPFHDGIADNQNSAEIATYWPSLTPAAFTTGNGGSASVRTLQARIGVQQDGGLGKKTAKALQKRLNTGRL